MELSDTTRSILTCCRWYGLAPYTIKRNKRNEIIDLKLSLWSCVFSFVLVVFFIISVEYASMTDPDEGYSLRWLHTLCANWKKCIFLDQSLIEFQFTHIRSKSTLSKYVYWLDMNLLLAAFVIHTIKTVVSVQNTLHVNSLLSTVRIHPQYYVNYFMFRRVMDFVSIDSICRWINILDYLTAAMNCIQFEQGVVFLCSCI